MKEFIGKFFNIIFWCAIILLTYVTMCRCRAEVVVKNPLKSSASTRTVNIVLVDSITGFTTKYDSVYLSPTSSELDDSIGRYLGSDVNLSIILNRNASYYVEVGTRNTRVIMGYLPFQATGTIDLDSTSNFIVESETHHALIVIVKDLIESPPMIKWNSLEQPMYEDVNYYYAYVQQGFKYTFDYVRDGKNGSVSVVPYKENIYRHAPSPVSIQVNDPIKGNIIDF